MSSASALFNPVPALEVAPRTRATTPEPAPRGFDETLEASQARVRPEPKAEEAALAPREDARVRDRASEPAAPESAVQPDPDSEVEGQGLPAADASAALRAAIEEDEPVLVSAELVGTTLQVQVALPDIVADTAVDPANGGAVTGDAALLPPWLDPFNNQAGLLTISLNTQPLLNGLIEGVASVLPAINGLAASASPILTTQLSSTAPGTTTLTPVLPVAEASTQGQPSGGGDANTSGSAFGSAAGNASTVATLNPATGPTAAFTLPAAAEAPTGVNPLLTNELNARPAGPGNAAPTLSTTLNPAGATAAEGSNDALNAARLSRGLNAAVNQQGGNITLRLTPPEMGTVRIQMTMQGGNVSAQFHAETDSARSLLTQQLGQLRSSLESQGLTVDRLGVQGMNNSSNSSGLQQQNAQSQQNQAEADGRSRGGQQQQPNGGNGNAEAQEDRLRDNLDNARDLFTDLLGEDPASTNGAAPNAA